MTERKQIDEKNLEQILSLRLFQDRFMNTFFDDYIEGVQLVVRIVLGRDDFQVISVKTQALLKNLQGRDVWLDIHAKSDTGEEFDVEIQRSSSGAGFKRARYHSSMMDAHLLEPGDDFNKLPDTYVIFITEQDVIGENRPIYRVNRQIIDSSRPFADGSHIIYVNGANQDTSTALGRLMHDFSCTKADDMFYPELAEKVRYLKETQEGREYMNDELEDWLDARAEERAVAMAEAKAEAMAVAMAEAKAEAMAEAKAKETALRMLADGLPLEKVVQYSGLSLEKVQELASKDIA